MSKKNRTRGFFIGVILPSVLTILLFIITIFFVIIPSFENMIIDRKKEMILELTQTAWSLMDEYNTDAENGLLSIDEAKKVASSKIEKIRYGSTSEDYFWIIDKQPNMIMHPYRKDLIGGSLANYRDSNGKKLFVEAVKNVEETGDAYIDYFWQWKNDSSKIVPKLSYVKLFEPWDWIVGTGIYLEDVRDEIDAMERSVLWFSLIILLIISFILIYSIRNSLKIEKRRQNIAKTLKHSRNKYQSLVNAGVDGTLILRKGRILFANKKINELTSFSSNQLLNKNFDEIFDVSWDDIVSKDMDDQKSFSIDAKIILNSDEIIDVVLVVSKLIVDGTDSYIVIVKEIGSKLIIENEISTLSVEIQTNLLLMNQPIKSVIKSFYQCGSETKIVDAVSLMKRKKIAYIFVSLLDDIVGIITTCDLRDRVLQADFQTDMPVSKFMSSPVISIDENSLLYEAKLLFANKNISFLAVKNRSQKIIGVISKSDIYDIQKNTLSFLIKQIEDAEDVFSLKRINDKVPTIVNSLEASGAKAQNITRIISSLLDSITQRVISLAIEQIGKPPCKFAFIAVGSEGRMEQTLATDQDNAIIYENVAEEIEEDVRNYFLKLANIINTDINKIGIKLCDGDVMAKNPKWTQSLSQWKDYFALWISDCSSQNILNFNIFYDFRTIFGEKSFVNDLRSHVNELAYNSDLFFFHMSSEIVKYKQPLSIFGNIISETKKSEVETIDIKKILVPIVAFVRIYSVKNQLSETNTLSRLAKLQQIGVLDKSKYNEIVLSYNYLMLIRFKYQVRQLFNNSNTDNIVKVDQLTKIQLSTVKKIFSEISSLKTKLESDFSMGVKT